MILSMGEFLRARRMQACDMNYATIARKLGNYSADQIREALKPKLRGPKGKRRRRIKPQEPASNSRVLAGFKEVRAPDVPETVMAERSIALSAPISITAAVFGDPPPGRSALDKRRGV